MLELPANGSFAFIALDLVYIYWLDFIMVKADSVKSDTDHPRRLRYLVKLTRPFQSKL